MAQFLSNPVPQFYDSSGNPLSSGTITAYLAGTTTLTNIYPTLADAVAGTNALPNPITINSSGYPQNASNAITPIVTLGNVKLVLKDSASTTLYTVDNYNPDYTITDSNGNELIKFTSTASAVNEITIANAVTGNAPIIRSSGESNIGLTLSDSNSNELIKLTSVASAVNEANVTNAATGNGPIYGVSGSNTNVDWQAQAKGTGTFNFKGTADASAAIRLYEDTDNGTNFTGLKAASSIASNVTFILPSADGTANQVMKTDGSGNLGFASIASALASPFVLDGTGSQVGNIRFAELTGNGTNYIGLKAPTSITTNLDYTLPATDGTAGQFLKTDGAGTMLWDSPSSTITSPLTPAASASQVGELRLSELTGGGSNYTGFKAPNALAADVMYEMPSADGSSGQLLSTNGSKVLSWASATSGWVLISTASASASATIDFTGLSSTYHSYLVTFDAVRPATNSVTLYVRIGTGAGPTYQSGASDYAWCRYSAALHTTPGATVTGDDADAQIQITSSVTALGNGVDTGANGHLFIINPASTASYHNLHWVQCADQGASRDQCTGNGMYLSLTAITAVRFLMSSGNITSGTFKLYGMKAS